MRTPAKPKPKAHPAKGPRTTPEPTSHAAPFHAQSATRQRYRPCHTPTHAALLNAPQTPPPDNPPTTGQSAHHSHVATQAHQSDVTAEPPCPNHLPQVTRSPREPPYSTL